MKIEFKCDCGRTCINERVVASEYDTALRCTGCDGTFLVTITRLPGVERPFTPGVVFANKDGEGQDSFLDGERTVKDDG